MRISQRRTNLKKEYHSILYFSGKLLLSEKICKIRSHNSLYNFIIRHLENKKTCRTFSRQVSLHPHIQLMQALS